MDLAILGSNTLVEKGQDLKVIETLGFSKCRVSIAIPKGIEFNGLKDLKGKKIATSYPTTVKKFLEEHDIEADLHIINGSVEIAPNIGLADAICDIVSSGSTLFKNNLKEVAKILDSEAVLVQTPKINAEQKEWIDTIQFRIQAVLRAKRSKYILLNAPNESVGKISSILPVLKSPTVLPLAEAGWSSIHSVINEGDFWEVIDQLKAAGAEDILICPIEKNGALMEKYISPNSATWEALLARPTATYDDLEPLVAEIFEAVKLNGDDAIRYYTKKFDGVDNTQLKLSQAEIEAASARVPQALKLSIQLAKENIERFHLAQKTPVRVATQKEWGRCWQNVQYKSRTVHSREDLPLCFPLY